jgi:hypothetical protein
MAPQPFRWLSTLFPTFHADQSGADWEAKTIAEINFVFLRIKLQQGQFPTGTSPFWL